MARFDVTGLDKVIKEMAQMDQLTGRVADAMLMAAAGVVREAWRYAIAQKGHIDTGSMFDKVGYPRKPTSVGDVRTIDIYPQGKDASGTRNAEKAFILHYGTSRRQGTFFVDDADRMSAEPVQSVMESIWTHFVETGEVQAAGVADWHAGG